MSTDPQAFPAFVPLSAQALDVKLEMLTSAHCHWIEAKVNYQDGTTPSISNQP